ncbi:D-alanyl-D-alanine carboxypeptidase [Actinospica sp. MGRD01-02]|uniref:D-alanyl-D-alanine carboxypeptidase n=1 Tax=Actinospica acidithermotolerans TaxID=2828514 RepID=A0A941IJP1_9ACTN|nr:D-alanyl-D-alanine carboxypeptidase [Actinospica acidithermotolerans]MBR7829679.1 D-alanyl-D-alanine carboxypeptidase [Actinospica acidithermotolerans]
MAKRVEGYVGEFGSRRSLIAGLALAILGMLGAACWSLAVGGPGYVPGLTVTAADPHDTDGAQTRLVQTTANRYVYPGSVSLTWPSSGSAAIEVEGMGLLGHDGSMTSQHAIASITKTLTAYVVLRDHPLTATSSGPTITLTSAMAATYSKAIDEDESAVETETGERITERQALEALMLASAGNMADILAIWDKGSIDPFLAAMNRQASALGMTRSHFTDPAGLAASTVSTMGDLLRLAEAVQKMPALTSIVSEDSASVPEAGTVYNVNRDLGSYGIDGIKTGTTAAAGSCLLFSAHITVGGRRLTIIGVVLGMPGSSGIPYTALNAAKALVASAERQIGQATVASTGRSVAALRQGGRTVANLGVADGLDVVGWPGLEYRVEVAGDISASSLTVTQTGGSAASVTIPLIRLAEGTAISEKAAAKR